MKLKNFFSIIFLCFLSVYGKDFGERLIHIEKKFAMDKLNDSNYFFYNPSDMKIDSKGRVYIVDTLNSRIQIFNNDGIYIRTIGRFGNGPGEFNRPEGIFIDEVEGKMYVCDTRNYRIQVYSLEGKLISIYKLKFAPLKIIVRFPYMYVLAFPHQIMNMRGESLIKIIDKSGKVKEGFLPFLKTENMYTNMLCNLLLMKLDKKNNIIIANQFCLNRVLIFDKRNKLKRKFQILYKAAQWVGTGYDFSIKDEKDLNKIAFIIADFTFDKNNNIYFLSGNIKKRRDGLFEKGREIYKYNLEGKYLGTIILPISGRLICIDNKNNLFLIDREFILRKYKILN